MRKICSSSNVPWSSSSSDRAESRSVPNGFSRMIRARGARPVVPEALDHLGVGARRQREVVEEPRLSADLLGGAADRVSQRVEAVTEVGCPQHRGESLPRLGRGRSVTALVDRLADEGRELPLVHLPSGDADDDEALGHQPRIGEVEHPREELAPREVAGRPEEDDHVILGDGRRRCDHGRLCGLDAHWRQFDAVPHPTATGRRLTVTLKKKP